ncbi:MAG: hypothetical protein M3313_09530 [Actinomycetota bacterium]|nr:hypothetical protein [Actinomycetota bacterium]
MIIPHGLDGPTRTAGADRPPLLPRPREGDVDFFEELPGRAPSPKRLPADPDADPAFDADTFLTVAAPGDDFLAAAFAGIDFSATVLVVADLLAVALLGPALLGPALAPVALACDSPAGGAESEPSSTASVRSSACPAVRDLGRVLPLFPP